MKELEAIKERTEGHTKGPWEVRSDSHPYRGGRFVHVEPLHGSRTICDLTDAHEANAELIAAAPKLLAALEAVDAALVKQVEHFREFLGKDRESMQHIANSNRAFGADCALDAARQAITEALQ